jgi:hypothetical protein
VKIKHFRVQLRTKQNSHPENPYKRDMGVKPPRLVGRKELNFNLLLLILMIMIYCNIPLNWKVKKVGSSFYV